MYGEKSILPRFPPRIHHHRPRFEDYKKLLWLYAELTFYILHSIAVESSPNLEHVHSVVWGQLSRWR